MVSKSKTYTIRKVLATVSNQRRGEAITKTEIVVGCGIGGVVVSKSFSNFEEGTLVDCVFRVTTSQSSSIGSDDYTVVSAISVPHGTMYEIKMSSVPEELYDSLSGWLHASFGTSYDDFKLMADEFSSELAESDSADMSGIVTISPQLEPVEAYELADELDRRFPGTLINVTKVSRFGKSKNRSSNEPEVAPSNQKVLPIVPEWIGNHFLTEEERENFGVIRNILQSGTSINIALFGPSGYGKTDKAQALATYLGVPLVTMDCSVVMDTESWFGQPEARDGNTIFVSSHFSKAIQDGNCVVVLDEANRIEPQLANSLFPILDHRRKTIVHGETITVGKGVVFVMTLNIGVKYAGTYVMDAALRNRVSMSWGVGALPQRQEAKLLAEIFEIPITSVIISQVIEVVTQLRKAAEKNQLDVDVSTRVSIATMLLATNGFTVAKAFRAAIVNNAAPEEQKILVDVINTSVKNAGG